MAIEKLKGTNSRFWSNPDRTE